MIKQTYKPTFYLLLISISLLVSSCFAQEANNNQLTNSDNLAETKSSDTSKTSKNWEFGVGVGGLNVSEYIGSNEFRRLAIPIPYIKYQGDFIKADRRGVRGVFWQNKDVEINMSFDFNLPVDSGDNKARNGMEDLNLGLEFGPALDYLLYQNHQTKERWNFKWPVRAAFEVTNGFSQYGWITSPRIEFQKQMNNWKWIVNLTIEFADKEYHSYFYNVEEVYVTDDRSFYDSKSGLLDYSLGTRISRRVGHWYFGGFVNYIDLSSAANVKSPLVKRQQNINFGAFLIKVF